MATPCHTKAFLVDPFAQKIWKEDWTIGHWVLTRAFQLRGLAHQRCLWPGKLKKLFLGFYCISLLFYSRKIHVFDS
jgi:hypothetical protein